MIGSEILQISSMLFSVTVLQHETFALPCLFFYELSETDFASLDSAIPIFLLTINIMYANPLDMCYAPHLWEYMSNVYHAH